jgi:hypothetical protein
MRGRWVLIPAVGRTSGKLIPMNDLFLVLTTVLFFGLALLAVEGCDRL